MMPFPRVRRPSTVSDLDGKFSFTGVKAGKYILTVSYIGYADLEKPITVGSSNLRLGELRIKEASHLLGEVSVVAVKTPIKVMEDTVEYNADSYHTQPNAVVEDLLKHRVLSRMKAGDEISQAE